MAPPQNEKLDAEQRSPSPSTSSSDREQNDSEAVNDKRLLRKLDRTLLPPLSILYLLSFLDRSNVANAKLEGLTEDLGISGDVYLTSLTLYFVGYVLFEIPCNIILKRTTPRLWLPTLTLVWGIVSTLMGLTQNRDGFLAVRFFLGVAESGLFPGCVWYLSMWYKRPERVYRVALFFSAASLAGAFGGILAFAIGKMRGVADLSGWRWIFILEGLLTIVVSIVSYAFIHNYPTSARFLTPSERSAVQSRLSGERDATASEPFRWSSVLLALKDPKCWLYGCVFHSLSLPLYTLSLFLPSIIAALGYTAASAQLLSVPPYAIATLLTLGLAALSERLHRRVPFILASLLLAAVGYSVLLAHAKSADPTHNPGRAYAGACLAAAGIYPATALGLGWPAMNVGGPTKRATATALQISVGNIGAVIGTQLYRPSTAPGYALGHAVALGYVLAGIGVVSGLWWVLVRENGRRETLLRGEGVAEGEAVQSGAAGGDQEEDLRDDDDLRWRFAV
ncbi:uncharacterized protein K452DRAFT_275577 [Aplosporella prunicola CBS 121167]|uniref:Major facilitator superfamily (MFS) profile domain-containing protein n=1 Tax=Aplosporella prunicola CBS 121167 TaxID=1176127 RepID=A0A6A6B7X0_9PEZI|nr:uncharacterized protein K452DRAFT_275577 [Aplosporella prunicola CBS 121167]KAF2139355.1 hypothetical protein K452DRAFT_275577 [Aplosporella prunicola CBS 121167]